ncbi:MAG TPA: monovalent cation/H+ antiporter subunit D [Casimicrobiaceae bacterium]|nr:monovalent cation/H+ antiporter subunit D [Casimicrobiaceae bacterium]
MTSWLESAMPALAVAPIVLPLAAAATMIALGERARAARTLVNLAASVAGLVVAIALVVHVDRGGAIAVYLPANWPVPYGIALVVDRLSALMLALGNLLGLSALLYATARWHRAGVHFHPLFQLQLMGLNGAFLTADLFNLFVFFEVMLAASYGLLLHGSGVARVRAGLHYVAVNLLASAVFLVGVAMIYGVTGTLNLADIAQKLAAVPAADRGLVHAGVAILAIAFLTKAAMWPLGFWLVPAYAAASAPAAALFAVMTKVGVYAVLRCSSLFAAGDAAIGQFGGDVLVGGGCATLAVGALGVLATQRLSRVAGACVAVSSGTLIAAVGFGEAPILAGALFYLVSSTLALAALYLLVELGERVHDVDTDQPEAEGGATGSLPFSFGELELPQGVNLDDEEHALVGRAMPAAVVFLGLAYLACALVIAGLPPLSGFLGKFTMLAAALDPAGLAMPARPRPGIQAWLFVALVIVSGLFATLALARTGMRQFWTSRDRPHPRLRVVECVAVALPLAACIALTVGAGPGFRYATATADALRHPARYIEAVLTAQPVHARAVTGGAR